MNKVFTDRSRIEGAYQRCKRLRWHEYHEGGMGIVSARKPLPLCVGGSVHKGLEHLLRCAMEPENQSGLRNIEDDAVSWALADFAQYAGAIDVDTYEQYTMVKAGATLEEQLKASLGVVEDAGDMMKQLAEKVGRARNDFDRYLFEEQCALVEAMVRAYSRRRLRELL
jgi:hypothetical protein